jgi:hypothetical protein
VTYDLLAEHSGGISNHWAELFGELERWEELLTALPDGSVDDAPHDPIPPD